VSEVWKECNGNCGVLTFGGGVQGSEAARALANACGGEVLNNRMQTRLYKMQLAQHHWITFLF
jgi:hypothetical protein